jgi:hypothetical protein
LGGGGVRGRGRAGVAIVAGGATAPGPAGRAGVLLRSGPGGNPAGRPPAGRTHAGRPPPFDSSSRVTSQIGRFIAQVFTWRLLPKTRRVMAFGNTPITRPVRPARTA